MKMRLKNIRKTRPRGISVSNTSFNLKTRTALFYVASSLVLAAASTAMAQETADAAVPQDVEIASGPMGQALVTLGDALGVNIIVSDQLVRGKSVGALSGSFTVEEALDRLLLGTGLQAIARGDGAFLIAEQTARPAAPAPQPADLRIEELVIVGTKRGLTVQETEVSLEVFQAERLDAENLFNIGDVIRRAPNISSAGASSDIVIRGVSRTGVGGAGQGVTSNVYIDYVPVSDGALFFDLGALWDVEQVEVLRGPQSTVQGRNALAGAIVVSTKDPTYEWEAAGRARYAERNTQQFSGVVSGPIIDNQLAFRVAVDHQATDGFTDFAATGEPATSRNALLLRGKLLVEPDFAPGFRGEFIAQYTDNSLGRGGFEVVAGRIGPDGEEPLPITDADFAAFDFFGGQTFITPQLNEIETLRFVADMTQELTPEIQLRVIGTYEDYDRTRDLGDLDNPTQFIENAFDQQETQTYSAEARLEYSAGRFSGSIGGYYFENSDDFRIENVSRLTRFVDFPVLPPNSLIFSRSGNVTDVRNFAFYAQGRFEISERWTIDAALRYDNERFETADVLGDGRATASEGCVGLVPREIVAGLFPGGVGGLPPIIPVDCQTLIDFTAPPANPAQSVTFDAFLPRAAITYEVNDTVSVFASFQRGYRAGGAFLSPSATGAGLEVDTFEPEFLSNYEIGLRSQWLDNRLTVNANLFYGRFSDQQVSIPNEVVIFPRTENAGSSELYGAELAADFTVTPDWTVYGSLGLLQTEFLDFQFAPEGTPLENLGGNEFARAPNVSFTLGGNYEHPSGVFANANMNFAGSSEASPTALREEDIMVAGLSERLDSRAIVNARLGYKADNFTLAIYAENLFDDRSRTNAFLGTISTVTGGFAPSENPSQAFALPRTIGVVLDVSF